MDQGSVGDFSPTDFKFLADLKTSTKSAELCKLFYMIHAKRVGRAKHFFIVNLVPFILVLFWKVCIGATLVLPNFFQHFYKIFLTFFSILSLCFSPFFFPFHNHLEIFECVHSQSRLVIDYEFVLPFVVNFVTAIFVPKLMSSSSTQPVNLIT